MRTLPPLLALAAILRGAAPERTDWDSVIAAANRCWLTPELHLALAATQAGAAAPTDALAYLGHIHARNRDRNRRLRAQLREAVAAMNACGVAPTLLKGALDLANAPENRLGARMSSDIDMIVPCGELAAASTCLRRLGYGQPEPGHDAYFTRPGDAGAVEIHRWPPDDPIYSIYAGLHGIDSAPPKATPDGLLFRTPPGHLRILQLALHDRIKEGDAWRGSADLRHLLDVARLAAAGVDWSALWAAPRNPGERRALEDTLLLAARLFDAPIPPLPGTSLSRRLRHRRNVALLTHPRLTAPLRIAGDMAWIARRLLGNRVHWPLRKRLPRALGRALRDPALVHRALIGWRTGPKG